MNTTPGQGRRRLLGALAAAAAGAALGPPAGAQPAEGFDFIALGDMPYGPDLIAGTPYRQLIDQVNALGLRFAVHVGDFKTGASECSDDEYRRQWQHFQRFTGALVYTPGDNDWLDCHRRGDDPLERLQALRERFFAQPQSLGQRPLALQRQSALMPAHGAYRENQRWVHERVVFATFHTVGQENGLDAESAAVRAEVPAREAANAAWIREAFALARQTQAPALVLATQAESLSTGHSPFRRARVRDPFPAIRDTLLPLAEAAPHPVLLVHGDHHSYVTDRPFVNAQGEPIAQLWRLQVFGAPRVHAVRVRVQPQVAGQPFAFSPVWNPMATDPNPHVRPTP